MFEPRYDQEDLPRFVEYLESQLANDEQVVRFEIINNATATSVSVEPIGAFDEFPAGSKYEVVALVKKDKPYLIIETRETDVIVWAMNSVAVFDKGVATTACQE